MKVRKKILTPEMVSYILGIEGAVCEVDTHAYMRLRYTTDEYQIIVRITCIYKATFSVVVVDGGGAHEVVNSTFKPSVLIDLAEIAEHGFILGKWKSDVLRKVGIEE